MKKVFHFYFRRNYSAGTCRLKRPNLAKLKTNLELGQRFMPLRTTKCFDLMVLAHSRISILVTAFLKATFGIDPHLPALFVLLGAIVADGKPVRLCGRGTRNKVRVVICTLRKIMSTDRRATVRSTSHNEFNSIKLGVYISVRFKKSSEGTRCKLSKPDSGSRFHSSSSVVSLCNWLTACLCVSLPIWR